MRIIKGRGFTLIELLIAVVVVGILAKIAMPTYTSYVQKSRRAEAKAALLTISQQLERYYTQQNTYATATLGTGGVYPSTSPNGYYSLSLTSLTATTYKILAAPAGVQSGDACGTLTLDDQSTQGVTGGTITDSKQCW
jgi:type IV pilus assembly protein PilE